MTVSQAHGSAPPVLGRGGLPAGLVPVMFLGVTAGTQMSDRGLQSVLLPGIKATLAVSDAEIGALQAWPVS